MAKGVNYINFNFDVSAYRLLGRELITDRITALFELVKNSYDANANKVTVEFQHINPLSAISKIIIRDDGLGMTLWDIKNKWMIIGTSSKRRERTSPGPYFRKVSGKKGVGRFAVDKLGSKLVLKTKNKGEKNLICLETDWSYYSELETQQLTLDFDTKKEYFTDVQNKYWYEKADPELFGTSLEISLINDDWTENDIKRAYKELSKLVSPTTRKNTKYPFEIIIKAPYDDFNNKIIEPNLVDFSTLNIELTYDGESKLQEILSVKEGKLEKIKVKARPFGLVRFNLYYFDQEAKRKYKQHFSTDIDGIKIYRDGIITTPFAEYVSDQNRQKDILGIDKRRYSGFFEKLSTRDLLGYIEITDENNPLIIESTNRQDFVDNEAYEELKLFVIETIYQIEKFNKVQNNVSRENTKSKLGVASDDLKNTKRQISEIKKLATPEVKEMLKVVESNLVKLQGSVNKGIKDFSKLEQESKQRENLFFSLVSLQTYAAMLSHMIRHSIGHILTSAEYFKDNFPNPKLDSRFKSISNRIYMEMLHLRKGVDFMLKYAKSDTDFEEININELVNNLFTDIYHRTFAEQKVEATIELNKKLIINYNRKAIEDIFDNLISNSLKALKNNEIKKIRCSGIVNEKELILLFSDNGPGIKEKDRNRIFDLFFTTSAEDGGAGIGLYVVKTRLESMQGEIKVINGELMPTGTTFEITLPFRK